jgi:hypothetical protein
MPIYGPGKPGGTEIKWDTSATGLVYTDIMLRDTIEKKNSDDSKEDGLEVNA